MSIALYLKEIGRGKEGARSLDVAQAHDLMGQVLDGRASDLEVGAFAIAMRIIKRFGASAIDIVKRSPYRLALDVWGIGFKTADQIARVVGVSPDAPERAQAGVLQVLSDLASRGHVYGERGDLVARAASMLELDTANIERAIDTLALSGRVIIEKGAQGGEFASIGVSASDAMEGPFDAMVFFLQDELR